MNNEENDPPVAERLAIESLEDYLQRYGLPPPNNINNDDGRNGEFNGLNRTEAQERMQAEKAYLDAFIEKHNSNEQAPLKTGFTPRDDDCQENGMISILLANKKRHDVPIKPMYQYCDTVRRMTVHRSRFGVANYNNNNIGNDDSDDATKKDYDCKSSENDDHKGDDNAPRLELSLEDFDVEATLQFISAVHSIHEHQLQQQQSAADSTEAQKSSTQLDQDEQQTIKTTSLSCTQHIIHLIDTQTISSNSIIEVLKLSHFLQCTIILDTLVSIVESSIDLENCLSICSLADALNLTSLFESSVNFVIRRLDAFQGRGSGDGDDADEEAGEEKGESKTAAATSVDEDSIEELWKSLPYDLRARVLTMRNILRSSIIGRGSKVSGIFFSSGNEFLAIFKETISVQKERLAEARGRLEEVVRERKEEFDVKRQRRGRWFDSSAAAEEKFVYSGDVAYSRRQIEKQSKRLATLESFYQEQKILFSKCGDGDCKISFGSR